MLCAAKISSNPLVQKMKSLKFLILSFVLTLVNGHSFLTDPDAYNRVFQLQDCFGRECKQACPNITENAANSRDSPARVWQRGQTVTIRWAKNNHVTGFVRFALVPARKMMKRFWHRRLSLYDGCWGQGVYSCTGALCGSDKSGRGFQRDLRIPSVFPDGDYVLGMVWYGGLRMGGKAFFSDYWSCSFVRIEGGEPLGGKYQAFFETGDTLKKKEKEMGKCLSAIDAPGVCPNDGCTGPFGYMVPRRYRFRRRPKEFDVEDVLKAMRRRGRPSPSPSAPGEDTEPSLVEDMRI